MTPFVNEVMVFQEDPMKYGFEKCRYNNWHNHKPIWKKKIYKYGNNRVDIIINGLGYLGVENSVDLQITGSVFDMADINLVDLYEVMSRSKIVEVE